MAIKRPPSYTDDTNSIAWKGWFQLVYTEINNLVVGLTGIITTKEEGVTLSTTVSTLNFVGTGVTASGAAATTTVTIPGSGITLTGTPVDNQIAVWTSASNLEGSSLFTWTGARFGIGIATDAWHTSATSIDLGDFCSIANYSSGFYAGSNFYINTSALYKYKEAGAATLYEQTGGIHNFYTTPVGSAEGTITWTERFSITLAGHIRMFAAPTPDYDTAVAQNYLQFSARTALLERAGSSYFLNNCFFALTGPGWQYTTTNAAFNMLLAGNVIQWRIAASGAANTAITWTQILVSNAGGSVGVGVPSLATTATDGFLCLPTCAGAPTGVPTAMTGYAQMVYDTTNNVLYVHDGAAWNLVA